MKVTVPISLESGASLAGSMTGSAREESSPTSPVTRSTSSCGLQALTPPKSYPARWLTTPIRKPPGCKTSARRCCAPRTHMPTSELTGTPRKASPPGATGGSSSWAPRAMSKLLKYVDIRRPPGGEHLIVVDSSGTEYIDCSRCPLPTTRSSFPTSSTARTQPAPSATPLR